MSEWLAFYFSLFHESNFLTFQPDVNYKTSNPSLGPPFLNIIVLRRVRVIQVVHEDFGPLS